MLTQTINAAIIVIGLATFIHGLFNGVVRKRIRNRFLRDMPYVTGTSAVIFGTLTALAGALFIVAGVMSVFQMY